MQLLDILKTKPTNQRRVLPCRNSKYAHKLLYLCSETVAAVGHPENSNTHHQRRVLPCRCSKYARKLLYLSWCSCRTSSKQSPPIREEYFPAGKANTSANCFISVLRLPQLWDILKIKPTGGGQRGGGWKAKKKQGRGGGAGGSGQQASHTLTHAEQARVGSGQCFRHFCFGAPCTWSGN